MSGVKLEQGERKEKKVVEGREMRSGQRFKLS